MTRSEFIRDLQEAYARQREENLRALEMRTREIEEKDPEIAALRHASALLAMSTLRKIGSLETREEKQACAEEMRRLGTEYSLEIRRRVAALGYPENALSLQYRCSQCRDTGLVGDAPARFCDCFERRLHERLYENGFMASAAEENFEHFRLDLFPVENNQRTQMANARVLCERYADELPKPKRENLLITGEGGLGKTFLLNCIYVRAVQRDILAIRTTAFRLNEAMRKRHILQKEDDGAAFDEMLEVPLLLIDDLGSEPVLRNVTLEYLFLLLNERMANHRNTVIATNLTPTQLTERYGQRVSSRLFDVNRSFPLRLTGVDIRKR